MNELQSIRKKVQMLYEADPHIHINVAVSRPKIAMQNIEATIAGVYPNIFCIEVFQNGERHRHAVQYTDIFTGQVQIIELNP